MDKIIRTIMDDWSGRPFVWGESDCCQFVAAIIKAITGTDPMPDFQYVGKSGAIQLIRKHGSLSACVTSYFGNPYGGPYKTGDIVAYKQESGDVVGIVYRDRGIVRTESGLTDWPLEAAFAGWCSRV